MAFALNMIFKYFEIFSNVGDILIIKKNCTIFLNNEKKMKHQKKANINPKLRLKAIRKWNLFFLLQVHHIHHQVYHQVNIMLFSLVL